MAPPRKDDPFPCGLLTELLPAGSHLVRIHQVVHGPIWFGPAAGQRPGNRFDAPDGQYRVLYAAARLEGAFVETVLRLPTRRIVGSGFLEQRGWTRLETARPLKLAKLYDEGLLWHGVDASVSATENYSSTRALALNLYQYEPDLDGISYRARHDNGEVCYALFDRVRRDELEAVQTCTFPGNWSRVRQMLSRYGAVLDLSTPLTNRP